MSPERSVTHESGQNTQSFFMDTRELSRTRPGVTNALDTRALFIEGVILGQAGVIPGVTGETRERSVACGRLSGVV